MKPMDDIKGELEHIRSKSGGMLYPEDVVAFAKNPKTKLHGKFTWDDSDAAKKYRLCQAQQIIRLVITVIPQTNQEVRMYVSLTGDRLDSGAYRHVIDVLSDSDNKINLIEDVLSELRAFQKKFAVISNVSEHYAMGNTILGELEASLAE